MQNMHTNIGGSIGDGNGGHVNVGVNVGVGGHGYGYGGYTVPVSAPYGGAGFELKPQMRMSIMNLNVEDIVWTQSRDNVPPMLNGRVSLSQWQATFDALEAICRKMCDGVKSLMPWVFIPCCVCCVIPKMVSIQREVHADYFTLVQAEQKKYHSAGIQVTLARELQSAGVGSNLYLNDEVVGLRFIIGQDVAAPVTNSMHAPSGDIAKQLETLNELYQTGALTKDEYKKAKSKILSA